MARDPIPTWFFAIVVVRLGHRFLLVHERKHGGHWYLPAGRVEPGETIVQAARRETYEESGISVYVEGVLRIEHTPQYGGTARVRVIVVATPQDDREPRSEPNEHTMGADWFSLREMKELSLRGPDVEEILNYVSRGAPIYPTNIITPEGAPFPEV
jgi:phosphatase NudJ